MAAIDVTAASTAVYPRVAVTGARPEVGRDASTRGVRIGAGGLLAALAAGALALWTVVPAGALWTAAHLSAGPSGYLAAALLIPAAIGLGGRGLVRIEDSYLRLTGASAPVRTVPAWRRSISDTGSNRATSVLDSIMAGSVLTAVASFAIWFLFFAHTQLPS
jgi:hypothetical protein